MISIELSKREVTTPGLYIMRWNEQTGLVRINGTPQTGWVILRPEKPKESYMSGLPENGQVPPTALLSEPLALSVN